MRRIHSFEVFFIYFDNIYLFIFKIYFGLLQLIDQHNYNIQGTMIQIIQGIFQLSLNLIKNLARLIIKLLMFHILKIKFHHKSVKLIIQNEV